METPEIAGSARRVKTRPTTCQAAAFHDDKIFIAGHAGMVGSALLSRLTRGGYTNIITRGRSDLDLFDAQQLADFFCQERPDYVFVAAARAGGISAANTYRAEFLSENLMIALNTISCAHKAGLQRLMFFASSCVYPRDCQQPMREDQLMSGPLEETNEAYSLAKLSGIKLCQAYNRQYGREYVSVLPCNLYGPADNYDPLTSHVVPALIRKAHVAKANRSERLETWGTGTARREFLFVDDLADACVHIMESRSNFELINIGFGSDLSVGELAREVLRAVDWNAELEFDLSMPDGVRQKLLDSTRLNTLGWRPSTSLTEGLRLTYEDYLARQPDQSQRLMPFFGNNSRLGANPGEKS